MAELLGYFLVLLALISFVVAGYSGVMVVILALRPENQSPVKVGFLRATKINWTDEMLRHSRRAVLSGLLFTLLSWLGAYLAGLPITVNGTRIQ
ncbi:hypothetical protein [Mesorhizobium muleiense]|uniref:hypothetical protein n=1 Tax=Mesorhizobium muleiense TaxID=1004279 RepID=UPI001F3AE2E2|nr:hypothetical protein [Mesorhizobium muleiense]MCF6110765.1 hypothetical protein [Mesorhizobium muleiense]